MHMRGSLLLVRETLCVEARPQRGYASLQWVDAALSLQWMAVGGEIYSYHTLVFESLGLEWCT
jgi:hypothetical protein